jgi:hypothetical protein
MSSEHGKLLSDSNGELQRGLDVVEFMCGVPHLQKGEFTQGAGPDLNVYSIREPLGVVAGIPPFNFPGMIPLWMLTPAIAVGNAFILKPSERAPSAALRVVELAHEAGVPPGIVNVVQGSQEVGEAIGDHPDIKAVTFIGSTEVARLVYTRGAGNGKRVQCMGGAKNHGVILPDADLDSTVVDILAGAFGSAGERSSLNFPTNEGFTEYNGLQVLTYFGTVFVAAPLAIITGLLMAPAIAARFGTGVGLLNRQVARTIKLVVLVWLLIFIRQPRHHGVHYGGGRKLESHDTGYRRPFVLGIGDLHDSRCGCRGVVVDRFSRDNSIPQNGPGNRPIRRRSGKGIDGAHASRGVISREKHLAILLGERSAAGFRGLPSPTAVALVGIFASHRRPYREPSVPVVRRVAGRSETRADHPTLLHSGVVGCG